MIALSPPARYSVILIDCTRRVVGGLRDELLDAAGEALVRVVDEQRPIADDGEDRAVGLLGDGDAAGRHRRPRLVLEVGAVERRAAASGSCRSISARWRETLRRSSSSSRTSRSSSSSLMSSATSSRIGLVEPAPAQLELDRFEQVVGLLLLERQVGVAGDPEHRPLLDDHADEERVQMGGDQLPRPAGSDRRRARTRRGKTSGTLSRTKRRSPVSGSATLAAMLSARLEMYGNGWPGSTASGVSTGKMRSS